MNIKSRRISGWDNNVILLLCYAGIFIIFPSTSNAFTNSKQNLVAHANMSLANQALLPLDNLIRNNGIVPSTLLVSASCYQMAPSVAILLCESLDNVAENKIMEKPCDSRIVNQYCRQKAIARNNQINLMYKINKGNLSKIFIQSCHHKNAKVYGRNRLQQNISCCQANITLINKNADYAFNIYVAMLSFWSVVTIAWLLNWVTYRQYSNKLHKIITLYPIVKIVALFLATARLQLLSTSGKSFMSLDVMQIIFDSMENPLLFAIIMLISDGYCIVKDTIIRYRVLELAVYFILFSISTTCMLVIHKYFLSLMVFCSVIMMYKSLKWCTYNIILLRRFLERLKRMISEMKFAQMTPITPADQMRAKLNILLRLRHICAIFSVAFAAAITLTSLLYQLLWIQALLFEIPKTFLYICIAYFCRLRNFAPYNEITLAIPSIEYDIIFMPQSSETKKSSIYLAIPLQNGNDLVQPDEPYQN